MFRSFVSTYLSLFDATNTTESRVITTLDGLAAAYLFASILAHLSPNKAKRAFGEDSPCISFPFSNASTAR